MSSRDRESLSHDPIHGYIPFTSPGSRDSGVSERDIIDHPWVQRLRQIHQLQTAWWVFPSAEHTRFQHVLGVMHLASRVIGPTLPESCRGLLRGRVGSQSGLRRIAAADGRVCCTMWGTVRLGTFSTSISSSDPMG